MKINEALKKERINRNLTQVEFCSGVITQASYSKIENVEHEIRAVDLYLLLSKNHIDEDRFFNLIKKDYQYSKNRVLNINYEFQIMDAFYNNNNAKLATKLNSEIQKKSYNQELKLNSKIVYFILTNQLSKLTQKDKDRYKRFLFNADNWVDNISSLRLFSNTMMVFDNSELDSLMNQLINNFSWDFKRRDLRIEKIVVAACVNYIDICYRRKNTDNLNEIFQVIDNLPLWPEFFVYRVVTNYFRNMINGDKIKATELKHFLSQNGLDNIVKKLPE